MSSVVIIPGPTVTAQIVIDSVTTQVNVTPSTTLELTVPGAEGPVGPIGLQGIQGVQGVQGIQGTEGVQGPTGPIGLQGVQGTQGLVGLQGLIGPIGPQGIQGTQGLTGLQGVIGPQGIIGLQGEQGAIGVQGIQGIQGLTGLQGLTGTQGLTGPTGVQGIQGVQGVQGVLGIAGTPGPIGLQGIQGIQGIQGVLGIAGTPGPQGIQGIQGVQGLTGAQGLTGEAGVPGIQGIQGIQGVQGLQGPQGLTGDQGVPGIQGIQGLTGSLDPNPTVQSLTFTTNTEIIPTLGMMTWDPNLETVVLGLPGGQSVDLGLELKYNVRAGVAISKGDVVYASGTVGSSGKIEVSPFIANNTIEAKYVVGVAAQSIAQGEFGYIVAFGTIRNFNTEIWPAGTVLYASPTVPGGLTSTRPISPNQDISVAFVINSAANGTIFARPTTGFNIGELHDVYTNGVINEDKLEYSSANQRWQTVRGNTFETVSKNLKAYSSTLNYTSGVLTSIVYSVGITKTLNYTDGNLTSIVLSGNTPSGITLTKTLSYTSGNLTGISYS